MKINLRTATGWRKATNKDKNYCDIDGARLWLAPNGKTKYCDKVHEPAAKPRKKYTAAELSVFGTSELIELILELQEQ